MQVSFEDIRSRRIPDGYVCSMILIWAAALPLCGNLANVPASLIMTIGLLLVGAISELILKKKTLGGGDVKLVFALTLYLGFWQMAEVIAAACALMLICLLAAGKRDTGAVKKQIPLGPAISVAGAARLLGV